MSEKKKLLIVDDSHEFSFLIVSLLKLHSHIEVQSENSSLVASRLIEKEKFDLFIIDYLMDDLNGLELIEKIRTSKQNAKTKAMLLTAKSLDVEELKVLKSLDATYMRKPIMPNEFYMQLVEMLEES